MRGIDTTARLIVTDYDEASRAIEQAWLDAGYDYDDIDMDMLHLAAEAVVSSQEGAPNVDRAARIDELERFAAKLASSGTTVGDAYQWAIDRLATIREEERGDNG